MPYGELVEDGDRISQALEQSGYIAAALIIVWRTLSFAWHSYRDRTNKKLQQQICEQKHRQESLAAHIDRQLDSLSHHVNDSLALLTERIEAIHSRLPRSDGDIDTTS